MLSSDEVIYRLSKLSELKLKLGINMSILTEEKRKEINDDHIICIRKVSYCNGIIRVAKKGELIIFLNASIIKTYLYQIYQNIFFINILRNHLKY